MPCDATRCYLIWCHPICESLLPSFWFSAEPHPSKTMCRTLGSFDKQQEMKGLQEGLLTDSRFDWRNRRMIGSLNALNGWISYWKIGPMTYWILLISQINLSQWPKGRLPFVFSNISAMRFRAAEFLHLVSELLVSSPVLSCALLCSAKATTCHQRVTSLRSG